MKVLHILYSGLGGHGSVFFSIVKGDEKHEITHEALFYGVEEVRKEYLADAAALGLKWYSIKKKAGVDIGSGRKTIRILKDAKPDVVFLHASTYIMPVVVAKYLLFMRFKIVSAESHANHLKPGSQWVTSWIAMLTANKIVLLTEEYKNELKKVFGIFFQKRKIKVIPNGIDLNLFKPLPVDDLSTIINIGMQSRITDIKDHTTLLKAFALIRKNHPGKKAALFIAGQGEYLSTLEQLVKELNIENEVHFTGMLPESELPLFISTLTIYVHATLGETMSTAIMQVMACKKPIIASDVKGVSNMLTNEETGLLVPAKNPEALANAILRLINDPALSAAISERAYKVAQTEYSNKLMFARYKAVFAGDLSA
jgi:glycosyltransferase involved in cell wall biosynthesis